MNQDLSFTVGRLIETYFPQLRRTVRKTLPRLTCAFLRLALSVRFGYGGLHLTAIARFLRQGAKLKSSYKWISPTTEVVRLYRQRMRIEHCFRDWKSHLGLRGFTLAYLILLLFGQGLRSPRSCVLF